MGKGRNRDALKAAEWGLLLNPLDPRNATGFRHCIDNGAWVVFCRWMAARVKEGMTEAEAMAAWVTGRWVEAPLDEDAFERTLDRHGGTADFAVLPDIVAGGMASLDLSRRWINRCLASTSLVLIAVQDGMDPEDLRPLVGTSVGIFLGGSTEWKLERMEQWGKFCASIDCVHPRSTADVPRRGVWYHVARVNTAKRFALAHGSGADSIDGSSATKFADTLPLLERARAQPDLYDPRRMLVA